MRPAPNRNLPPEVNVGLLQRSAGNAAVATLLRRRPVTLANVRPSHAVHRCGDIPPEDCACHDSPIGPSASSSRLDAAIQREATGGSSSSTQSSARCATSPKVPLGRGTRQVPRLKYEGAGASGCRHACGAGCPNTCETLGTYREVMQIDGCSVLVEFPNAIKCGTHEGCRWHDDCFDSCRQSGERGQFDMFLGPCHNQCSNEAFQRWPAYTPRWMLGFGPYQGYLYFSDQPIVRAVVPQPGSELIDSLVPQDYIGSWVLRRLREDAEFAGPDTEDASRSRYLRWSADKDALPDAQVLAKDLLRKMHAAELTGRNYATVNLAGAYEEIWSALSTCEGLAPRLLRLVAIVATQLPAEHRGVEHVNFFLGQGSRCGSILRVPVHNAGSVR